MTFGVANIERQQMINNVSLLAKTAREFNAPMTTIATTLEFQRDWTNKEHYDAMMDLYREHGGAYGNGIEYAYSMVHKAPQAANHPHILAKS